VRVDRGLTRPAGLALRAAEGGLSRSARLTRPAGLALWAAYGCRSRSARLTRPAGLALWAAYGCRSRSARLTRRTGLALWAAYGCRSRSARLRSDEAHRPRPTRSLWLSAFGYLRFAAVVSLRPVAVYGNEKGRLGCGGLLKGLGVSSNRTGTPNYLEDMGGGAGSGGTMGLRSLPMKRTEVRSLK
jgi:hypothetical protein